MSEELEMGDCSELLGWVQCSRKDPSRKEARGLESETKRTCESGIRN